MKTIAKGIIIFCCLALLSGCAGNKTQPSRQEAPATPVDSTTKKEGLELGEAGDIPGWEIRMDAAKKVGELRDGKVSAELKEGEIILLVSGVVTNTAQLPSDIAYAGNKDRRFYLDLGEVGRLPAANSLVGEDFYKKMEILPNQSVEGYFVFRLNEKTYNEAGSVRFVTEQGEDKLSWNLK